ncbi:MAG: hypothetical protein PSN34_07265, partial [Urechidicola sp.]|nr:hypothetical protein [Urechidicola sp.]
PFGMKHVGYNSVIASTNPALRNKYNGKEFEESIGLNLYEMDMRSYDPAIARWTSIDPVTHHSMSTYTAFDNNPIYWADPSGAISASSIMDAFNKSGDGTTTWFGDGEGGYTDTPQEGQSRAVTTSFSINPLDGMERTTYKIEYYHNGGINGSEAKWYSENEYGNILVQISQELASGSLSSGSIEWFKVVSNDALAIGVIINANRIKVHKEASDNYNKRGLF